MQYLLLIYADEATMPPADPSQPYQISPAYMAYTQALKNAKVWRGGERLQPTANATTLRLVKGKTEVLNGPYAETKEQLGGYYLIEVPDLDAALSWASRCPSVGFGSIEVRPLWLMQ